MNSYLSSVCLSVHPGLHKLMNVAGQVPELKRLRVTSNTRMHASVALDKLYEEMRSDKQRAYYQDMADKFVRYVECISPLCSLLF